MPEFVSFLHRLIADNADFQVMNLGDQEGFRALGAEVPMDLSPPVIEGLPDIIPDSDVTRPEDGWYPLPVRDGYLGVGLGQWRRQMRRRHNYTEEQLARLFYGGQLNRRIAEAAGVMIANGGCWRLSEAARTVL